MSEYQIPAGKIRLNMAAVCYRYGHHVPGVGHRPMSEATIYRALKRGEFPKPDKIGGSNSWTEDVLDTYDDQLRRDAEQRAA